MFKRLLVSVLFLLSIPMSFAFATDAAEKAEEGPAQIVALLDKAISEGDYDTVFANVVFIKASDGTVITPDKDQMLKMLKQGTEYYQKLGGFKQTESVKTKENEDGTVKVSYIQEFNDGTKETNAVTVKNDNGKWKGVVKK